MRAFCLIAIDEPQTGVVGTRPDYVKHNRFSKAKVHKTLSLNLL